MPVTYEIDQSQEFIHTKCMGKVTFDEVSGHFRELEQNPACPKRLDVLLELAELTGVPDADELMGVSEIIGSIRERVEFEACAIVGSTDLLFGVSRMFEAYAKGQFRVTRVFRGIPEAKAWLAEQRSRS